MTRSGNRQFNAALHRIAVTQIRLNGLGETYYRKRIDAGDSTTEAPEDPSGIPPKNPPGPESTQPGPAPVIVPPILETPGGRPLGVPGGGAG
jgi:hypothetical protein